MTSTQVSPGAFDGSVFAVDEVGSNGVQFRRNTWLRAVERRLPRGTSANVTVRTTTIPAGQATEWRVVNGVTYTMVLAGEARIHWADGEVSPQPRGSAFTLDIARVHRIENPASDASVIVLTLYVTSPDRHHVVPVLPRTDGD